MADLSNTYWSGNGSYGQLSAQLRAKIPESGSVTNVAKNKHLERFRKACNCYYDLYNNGLCNRARSFTKLFGIHSWMIISGPHLNPNTIPKVEKKMDEFVLNAAKEQGLA